MKRWVFLTLLLAGVVLAQEPIRAVIVDANGDGKPDRRGQTVTITGIVTAPDSLFDQRYTDIYVQDTSAGVNVFSFTMQDANLGDSVLVTGRVQWYRGKTEVDNAVITRLASDRPLPEPRILTCADANGEQYEGELVRFVGVTTTALILAANTNYNIQDQTGTTQMRIDADTRLAGLVLLNDTFTLTAIKSQYCSDTTRPLTGYQMLPRYRSDFSRTAMDMPILPIESVQAAGPDGVTPARIGQMVRVRGWVSGPAYVFTSGAKSWYLQDSTAGVNVYGGSYDSGQVGWLDSLGAYWEVIGTVTEYNGLTELANGAMVLVDTTRNIIAPRELPFNVSLTERMESDLVWVTADVVQAPYQSGPGYNMTVKNGSAAIALRINNTAFVPPSWLGIRGRRVRVTGIVGQYDSSEPYTSGYQLMPRFLSDVVDVAASYPQETLGLVIDSIVPQSFVRELGQTAKIYVNSPTSGYRIDVDIFDREGRLVRELLDNGSGGFYELRWDGTDRLGRPKPAGIYLVNAKAARGDGRTETVTKPVVLAVKLN